MSSVTRHFRFCCLESGPEHLVSPCEKGPHPPTPAQGSRPSRTPKSLPRANLRGVSSPSLPSSLHFYAPWLPNLETSVFWENLPCSTQYSPLTCLGAFHGPCLAWCWGCSGTSCWVAWELWAFGPLPSFVFYISSFSSPHCTQVLTPDLTNHQQE